MRWNAILQRKLKEIDETVPLPKYGNRETNMYQKLVAAQNAKQLQQKNSH